LTVTGFNAAAAHSCLQVCHCGCKFCYVYNSRCYIAWLRYYITSVCV